MKKYILKSLFVSMLCMLAASCQDTDEFAQTVDNSKTQVMFTIAMDSPLSRSGNNPTDTSWGGTYENCVGDDYDNRIALNQLVAEIETAEGKKYPVSGIISEDNKYSFVGVVENIKSSITLKNAKITVYANMGDKAQNRTFKQKEDFIPMWGFQTMSELKLEPGTRAKIDPISLLRAMAKIEVALNEEMAQDYTLSAVTLNKYNEKGNSLPTIPTDPSVQNTKQLDQEKVFNVNQSEGKELGFVKNETNASWSVYLPEVKNNSDLEITVVLQDANGNEETGKFNVMDYNYEEPLAMDIVRNHWYKYTISGFAESEIQVSYNTVGWEEKFIEIGSEGFLFLNKDVIEIYNSNIDADQLTFASSSPIKSIELMDLYNHHNNGKIVEGTTDGVSAYYISKFGQKIQLGSDPGFDISDKEAALARETVILNNIKAIAEANTLNGGITIKSPFLAEPSNEIPELQQNSHYDTPRYLEFLVTNMQGSKATFRVIQYPPVVITNEEGYFSYRSDQKFSDDQEEASHYHNYMGWQSFHLTGLMWGYEFDWTNVPEKEDEDWFVGNSAKNYSSIISNPNAVTSKAFCEVLHYGNLGAPHTFIDNRPESVTYKYGGLYKSTTYPTDAFLRHRYYLYPGGQSTGKYCADNNGNPNGYSTGSGKNKKYYYHERGDVQGLAVGPYYERDGRTYRKQFVWNIQPIFYNLYVSKVYDKNEGNRLKGQADLNSMTYSVTMEPGITDGQWVSWGKQSFTNHRMYIVRSTISSSEYNIGHPTLTDEGVTENTVSNANMISPKFAVASQLGETFYQSIITLAKNYNYKVPVVGEFYKLAVEHCREYVETTFIDKDGDHEWDSDETVIHYDDWRLPTKAEINAIINYQNESRAMDRLLIGQYYFCVAGDGDADVNVKENWVSKEVAGFDSASTGYYIRCVRDVKPEGQNGFIGK